MNCYCCPRFHLHNKKILQAVFEFGVCLFTGEISPTATYKISSSSAIYPATPIIFSPFNRKMFCAADMRRLV